MILAVKKVAGMSLNIREDVFIFFVLLFMFPMIGEASMYRLSEEYWKGKGNVSECVLDATVFNQRVDEGRDVIIFEYRGVINLGNYKSLSVNMITKGGKDILWGWKSKRTGDEYYYPYDNCSLISDGKVHTYTFMLRFPDKNNPIFDIVDSICFEVRGVKDNIEGIAMEKVVFQPYDNVRPKQMTISGVCMDVLWDEEMEMEKDISDGSRLIFYTGIYNPDVGSFRKKSTDMEWKTDGSEFTVLIDDHENRDVLYQLKMNPKINKEDRFWRRAEIDLSRYKNKNVKIIFRIEPMGNTLGNFSVWGNPIIVTKKEKEDTSTPPIFIISCDTLRPDHLLPYGYDLPTSPCLDEFAKDAVVFENSYTTQTFTPVAHMSLLTGLHPESHGLKKNIDLKLEIQPLPEILREYGYQTAGFAGFLWWFVPSRGFSRGMDYFSVPETQEGGAKDRRSVFEVHEDAKTWIRQAQTRKIFVFMHNYDIHSTAYKDLLYDAEEEEFKVFSRAYKNPRVQRSGCENIPAGTLYLLHASDRDIIPTEQELQYNNALYDDCIYKVDTALGDFFNFLKKEGLYDPAFIAIVSDHGESLGEHELYGHKNVYEESMRNVMIVKFPFQKYSGQRIKEKVILEDIIPTLFAMLDTEREVQTDGISLYNFIENKKIERDYIFSTDSEIEMKAIVKGHYKLLENIKRGECNLFDLSKPMAEYRNIMDLEPKIFDECQKVFAKQFRLKKEGWCLYFQNMDSFLTETITIKCTVPIVNVMTQSCVFRIRNDRLEPTKLEGTIFIPSGVGILPTILQIIPAEDNHELIVQIQKKPKLIYPQEYKVIEDEDKLWFHFSSNDKQIQSEPSFLDNVEKYKTYFNVNYYPIKSMKEEQRVEMNRDVQEQLRNLGYLN